MTLFSLIKMIFVNLFDIPYASAEDMNLIIYLHIIDE